MFIYDHTSLAFIKKAETVLKEILTSIEIEVHKTRFFYQGLFCPIHIVVFEGSSELAHFDHAYYQIGLNKKLIYAAKDSVLRDIIKHELAHYLTYIKFGPVKPHGEEFKKTCLEFGFGTEISKSTMDLNFANDSKEGDLDSERILNKVQKLLNLAQSSNAHEAELATLKANSLLLRHNLEHLSDIEKDEPIYLSRVLIQKRKDAKLTAIYEMLKHFIVRPVISYGKEICSLEVSGSLTNVKLAQYVANFLNQELDRLWEHSRIEHSLNGLRAKNSFFAGIARGFDLKMKESKHEFSTEEQKALILVEKNLIIKTHVIYKRLSSSHSNARNDTRASQLGEQKGKNLKIRQGVEGKMKNLYLSFTK